MRQELINTLDGSFPEIAKKQKAILRKIRTPLKDNVCACVSLLTKEPDKDHFCPYCMGEGYYWDESFIDVYKVDMTSEVGAALADKLRSPGLISSSLVIFYTRYSGTFTKNDKIIEIELDVEGVPVSPYQRHQLFRIGNPIDFRADNGRLEYWKLLCVSDERKFLNGV
jgi:hypothetical protein